MKPFRLAIHGFALAGLLGLCAGAAAQMSTPGSSVMTARLSGASEVPPAAGGGSGTLQATLDKQTRVLTWSLTIAGLSGPATTCWPASGMSTCTPRPTRTARSVAK